jgi:hypothetical protein
MKLFPRISFRNAKAKNAIPRRIEESGVDEQVPFDKNGVDLYDKVPHKVRRTVKNARYAATDPFVRGVLTDIFTKTNTYYEIHGDNQKAVDFIIERDKEWNINQFIDETLEKGIVDGEAFIYTWWEEGHLKFQYIYYDQEDYRIKEIYDEQGFVEGYKYIMRRNEKTNTGWRSKLFQDLVNEDEDYERVYEIEEIIPVKYNPKDGRGRSLVMNILDPVYYRRSLIPLMPLTIYKNSNIFHVTMGNEVQPGLRLDKKARDKIVDGVSDYHKKGAIVLPYGVEAEMIKGGTLPDIPSYLKYLESLIYIGLNTPEAVFSSESSNRATADIQLDSPTTGRVLFLQYNQEWVKKIIEENIFRPELDENGFSNSEVWIEFNNEAELDSTDNTEETTTQTTTKKPIQKKGQDYNVRDTVGKQNTSGTDRKEGQVGGNGGNGSTNK